MTKLMRIYCQRRSHLLATVVDDDGRVFVEVNRAYRSAKHHLKGTPLRRELTAGSATRMGCACGSTLIRDKLIMRQLADGVAQIITPV